MNAENYYHSDTEYKGKEVSNQPCGREEKKLQKQNKSYCNYMKTLWKVYFQLLHFHVWPLSDSFCLIVIWNRALEDTTAASPLNLESVAKQLYSASEQWT